MRDDRPDPDFRPIEPPEASPNTERWICNWCGELYADWGEPDCPYCGRADRRAEGQPHP